MSIRTIKRDERGTTIVLAALSLIALLGLTGIVIDGGRAYSDHRQAQNAADSAALAGANALNTYLTDATKTAPSIWTAVQSSASTNSTTNTPTCVYVDSSGTVLNPGTQCSAYSGRTVPANASGVEVRASDTQKSDFIQVLGISTFTAAGTAQAQVQALAAGRSPIMLCAVDSSDPRSTGDGVDTNENDQLNPGGTPPIFLAGTDNINPAAIFSEATQSPRYWLKGVEVKKTCGTSANFKGRVVGDGDNTYPIPGAWPGDNGNSSGPFRTKLANFCTGETVGCRVLIPLCYGVAPAGQPAVDPSNDELWCPKMGVFKITSTDSNSDIGGLIELAPIVEAGSGGGQPGATGARVIKLTR
jgi:Flp pilus assembly protein TadG